MIEQLRLRDEAPAIAIGAGEDNQTASATFDVTFNLTLTKDHFDDPVGGAVTLGGEFGGKTATLTRTGDTTATLRIEGNIGVGSGTFQLPQTNFAGTSDNHNYRIGF